MTERVWLTRQDVDALIERAATKAAEEGAMRALARLGLDDKEAADDLRELRGILAAWETAKKKAWETIVSVIVMAILAALAAGVAISTWRGVK